MTLHHSLRFTLTLVSAFLVAGAGTTAQQMRQTVSVEGVSAEVVVGSDFQHGGHFLEATFHQESSNTNTQIACLSVYRDFTYRLNDASGRAFPVNQSAIEHPPFGGESTVAIDAFGPPRKGRTVPSCSEIHLKAAKRVASLSALYPDLPPGTYTLRIAFAPRGASQSAQLSPITFTLTRRQGL